MIVKSHPELFLSNPCLFYFYFKYDLSFLGRIIGKYAMLMAL